MSGKLGRRAVVVGAGIAGLSAAGVLAKYFDQVDILERDQTPLSVETRSGTPQDNHAHGLLAEGLKALNEIYPDFDRDLAAAGAVSVNVPGDIRYEKPGVAELPQRDFGIPMLSASRPLIEFGVATADVGGWKCPAVPMSLAAYNEAFNAPLQFDAGFNGFLISEEDVASKLPTAIPQLAELHDRIAGQALRRLVEADTTHRAREAIARQLQDGSPLRSTIAAELTMSDHTFQRRLASEGTSFTNLVDDTRKELAQHHLADPRVTFAEIAYLLGYADQSTFFRATHRWFGEPPGEYRTRVLGTYQQEIAAAHQK